MINNPAHKTPLMLIDDDGPDIIRDALLPRQTITIDHSPIHGRSLVTAGVPRRHCIGNGDTSRVGVSNEAGYVLSWVWGFLITYFIFRHYFIGSVLIGWT